MSTEPDRTIVSFVQYAEYYDLLYKDKDYYGEALFVKNIVERYGPRYDHPLNLLDLACGTGRHIFELEAMGFIAEGTDLSSAMIAKAVATAKQTNSRAHFYNFAFQEAHRINKKYHIIISMFSAIDYLTSFVDLTRSFQNVQTLLSDDGIFIFDFWNGNAVLRDYDPVRVIRKGDSSNEILRISETRLNVLSHIATVKFTCLHFENGIKIRDFIETHSLRYFFIQEMTDMMTMHGFEVIHTSPFLMLDSPLDPYDWNVSFVVRKR